MERSRHQIGMNEITYKRELNHSYMVIGGCVECMGESYAYRMMTQNRIGRLLDCGLRQTDGESFLYYDISSRQPLERLYEAKKLDVEGLKRILYAVAAMQEDLGEYLLDEQGLMLDSKTVFADVETEELYFCFYPGERPGEDRYARLADFFLGHVDHGDEHAVNIAYRFYQMSKAEYFVLSAFLPFLEKELAAWRQKQDGGMEMWPAENEQEEVMLCRIGDEREREAEAETGEKKGWLQRLLRKFGAGLAKRPRAAKEREKEGSGACEEQWPDMVWDSYVAQSRFGQNGETVYFADLEKPAAKPAGVPCLIGEDGEERFYLENLPITVGKLKGKVSVVLEDRSVSRMHARLEYAEGGICVRDLNSRNGTLVNGRKLLPDETMQLTRGDLVQFGRERFRFDFVMS